MSSSLQQEAREGTEKTHNEGTKLTGPNEGPGGWVPHDTGARGTLTPGSPFVFVCSVSSL
jgi:hypothetical protein